MLLAVTMAALLYTLQVHTVHQSMMMVLLLLANGADVHKHTNNGETALELAASTNHVGCARALLAAGADINKANSQSATCLHMAVQQQHCAVAQLLLVSGAAAVMHDVVNATCENGEHSCNGVTAIMICRDTGTLKALLAAGAYVHVTNDTGNTCLHAAAKHKWCAPMICLLIKAGATLSAVNNTGKTAAQLAHDRGYALIEQLLNRAAQQV
jgi:ankyrin repeat protein